MPNVSFEEEPSLRYASSNTQTAAKGITGFLLRYKIVKDVRTAQYVLIAIVVASIVIIIFMTLRSNVPVKKAPPLPSIPGVVLPTHPVR